MHRRTASGASDASRSSQLPPLAACFLIRFDKRVGYTVAWKRATEGLELEGEVEYKSLPSGLHNIKEDLIYFIHAGHAGLSAFVQEPDSEAERNVRFVAVGILTPLDFGRFGRGWLHAEHLQDLAKQSLQDVDNIQPLEDYWQRHGLGNNGENEQNDTMNMSESTVLASSRHDLSPFHPILSISAFLDDFGPLVFPLYRSTLLRQRILFIKPPPIRICCEFVYILSVIASIPPVLADTLPDPSVSRITPLFNICIHDIPKLEQTAQNARYSDNEVPQAEGEQQTEPDTAWIACTSDEVFSTKTTLTDVRVRLPKPPDAQPQQKQWPSIQQNQHSTSKASQRDLRRYRALRQALSHLQQRQRELIDEPERPSSAGQSSTLLSRAEAQTLSVEVPNEGAIVEPPSWAAVAYDSYMWWASAGERSADLQEEYEQDADLLFTAADVWEDAEAYARREDINGDLSSKLKASGALEMAVVAYFHRMTATIFEILGRIVDDADDEADGNEEEDEILPALKLFVAKEDLAAMGLDPWSQADRDWVAQMVKAYFGREAEVEGASIECCGVKIY